MTEHRPWPRPSGNPTMVQTWHDLLFAHWPVSPELLRRTIPPPLEVDVYDGQAWLAVVPFRMSGIRPWGLPAVPGISALPELNLRTYVTDGTKPGVYFFCLDAGSPIAVALARRWYHLPYFRARMRVGWEDGWVRYSSRRTHRGAEPAVFEGWYRPVGEPYHSTRGTVEHWFTERYCLYTPGPRGRVYRSEIDHVQWPLQPAVARIDRNTLPEAHGLTLPDTAPILHYSRRLDVRVWSPERLRTSVRN